MPGPSGGDPFCLLANCFQFFCSRKLAGFIFSTLLADYKDPIYSFILMLKHHIMSEVNKDINGFFGIFHFVVKSDN